VVAWVVAGTVRWTVLVDFTVDGAAVSVRMPEVKGPVWLRVLLGKIGPVGTTSEVGTTVATGVEATGEEATELKLRISVVDATSVGTTELGAAEVELTAGRLVAGVATGVSPTIRVTGTVGVWTLVTRVLPTGVSHGVSETDTPTGTVDVIVW